MARYCDHGGYGEHRIGDGECALCGDMQELKDHLAAAIAELTAASAVIAAAEEMREDTCHGDKLEAFDAAMAEWRRVKGPLPQHPDHRDNCGSGCGNDQNGG